MKFNRGQEYQEPLVPERILLAAVLRRAVLDLSEDSAANIVERRDAIAWIRGRPGLFTFKEVIERLGLPISLINFIKNKAAEADIKYGV